MLRITETTLDPAGLTLKLEGRIAGPWVDLLERQTSYWAEVSCPLRLDLSWVTYVDADGIDLLRRLEAAGIRLVKCPGPIRGLMEELEGQP